MHHWCKRSLQKGEVLRLVREHDNPVDVNAIALFSEVDQKKWLTWDGQMQKE